MYCLPKTVNYLIRLSSFNIDPNNLIYFIGGTYRGLTDNNSAYMCELNNPETADELLLYFFKSLKIQKIVLATNRHMYVLSELLINEIESYPAYLVDGSQEGGYDLAVHTKKYLYKYPNIRSIVNRLIDYDKKYN